MFNLSLFEWKKQRTTRRKKKFDYSKFYVCNLESHRGYLMIVKICINKNAKKYWLFRRLLSFDAVSLRKMSKRRLESLGRWRYKRWKFVHCGKMNFLSLRMMIYSWMIKKLYEESNQFSSSRETAVMFNNYMTTATTTLNATTWTLMKILITQIFLNSIMVKINPTFLILYYNTMKLTVEN